MGSVFKTCHLAGTSREVSGSRSVVAQGSDNVEAHPCRAMVFVHHLADTAWVVIGADAYD